MKKTLRENDDDDESENSSSSNEEDMSRRIGRLLFQRIRARPVCISWIMMATVMLLLMMMMMMMILLLLLLMMMTGRTRRGEKGSLYTIFDSRAQNHAKINLSERI